MLVTYEYKISYMRGLGPDKHSWVSYANTVEQVEKYLATIFNTTRSHPDLSTLNIEAGGFDVEEMRL